MHTRWYRSPLATLVRNAIIADAILFGLLALLTWALAGNLVVYGRLLGFLGMGIIAFGGLTTIGRSNLNMQASTTYGIGLEAPRMVDTLRLRLADVSANYAFVLGTFIAGLLAIGLAALIDFAR